jgi:hypothetical protein
VKQEELTTARLGIFLESLSRLDVGQLLAIATAHREQGSDLNAARDLARRRLLESGRADEYERLIGDIVQWSGADGARSGIYTFASPIRDMVLADARAQAVPALADAALSLFLGDEVDAPARQMLLAAWESEGDRGDGANPRSYRKSRDIRRR